MKAVTITKYGLPSVLQVREYPDLVPAVNEVRVKVHACGLNFAEVSARHGLYPDAPKAPCVVGYEGAGIVDQVGAEISGYKVGDRVIYMSRFGGQAEQVCVPVTQLAHMPLGMTFEEGAAIPVNYLTAYHMLHMVGRVRSGDRVLIHMAAGGVGTAVVQLANAMGGVEIFGTASKGKHGFLKGFGCHHPLDYNEDWVSQVMQITEGKGLTHALDPRGGKDWEKSYSALQKSGMLIAFGLANAHSGQKRNWFHVIPMVLGLKKYSPMDLCNDNKGIAGVNLGHLWEETEMLNRELAAVLKLYEEGKFRPKIDSVFSFHDAAKAHLQIEERKNIGKVILIP